ncbi:MAG: hypothetical protein H6737_05815 [Alphaproteobacteria bacterium]|nr:hypothetical protein [Alphaproteobacteria bacterium]
MRILPVIALVACSPDLGPPTCEGGGAPLVEVGDGGQTAFVAFGDGATIPTRNTPAQADLELWTSGLVTTAGITAVVRIAADGGPTEDSLATLTFVCADTGNGWTNVLAALPASAVSGSSLSIDVTLTDSVGTTASTSIEGIQE